MKRSRGTAVEMLLEWSNQWGLTLAAQKTLSKSMFFSLLWVQLKNWMTWDWRERKLWCGVTCEGRENSGLKEPRIFCFCLSVLPEITVTEHTTYLWWWEIDGNWIIVRVLVVYTVHTGSKEFSSLSLWSVFMLLLYVHSYSSIISFARDVVHAVCLLENSKIL